MLSYLIEKSQSVRCTLISVALISPNHHLYAKKMVTLFTNSSANFYAKTANNKLTPSTTLNLGTESFFKFLFLPFPSLSSYHYICGKKCIWKRRNIIFAPTINSNKITKGLINYTLPP